MLYGANLIDARGLRIGVMKVLIFGLQTMFCGSLLKPGHRSGESDRERNLMFPIEYFLMSGNACGAT
jgi:hypothetical protein